MSTITLKVTIDAEQAASLLQRVSEGLANRSTLHARIAQMVEKGTRDHVTKIAPERHKTAQRLGATPTGHLSEQATAVESAADREAAYLLIPGMGALARAFGPVTIYPKNVTMLAEAAHATTYGKWPREFPRDAFWPVVFDGRHPALVFADGPFKGSVAYWLHHYVTLPEDRTLLPYDEDWQDWSALAARMYIDDLAEKGVAA